MLKKESFLRYYNRYEKNTTTRKEYNKKKKKVNKINKQISLTMNILTNVPTFFLCDVRKAYNGEELFT